MKNTIFDGASFFRFNILINIFFAEATRSVQRD